MQRNYLDLIEKQEKKRRQRHSEPLVLVRPHFPAGFGGFPHVLVQVGDMPLTLLPFKFPSTPFLQNRGVAVRLRFLVHVYTTRVNVFHSRVQF